MYNNLENETLILKRLESALANEDNDLLKIASYKLHEKFHSGHKFEYIKQLKSVYDYVYDNPVFDEQISLLLTSTIEDIINQKDEPRKEAVSAIDSIFPASNTFSSYSTEYKNETQGTQQTLFSNFTQESTQIINNKQGEESQAIKNTAITSEYQFVNNFSGQKTVEKTALETAGETAIEAVDETAGRTMVEAVEETAIEAVDETAGRTMVEAVEETAKYTPVYENTEPKELEKEITETQKAEFSNNKNICLFLSEKNTDVDEKFIKDFIKTLNKDETLSKELNEIQAFINLAEQDLGSINKIIEPIKNSSEKLSIITDSINGKILEILKSCEIENTNNFNFYPLSGLTRVLECVECGEKHTNYSDLQIISAVCPICGNYMLPNIEMPKKCNVLEFEKALLALFKSNIWVLINPPKEDKKEFVNMFKMASRLNKPEKIYILTQDEAKKALYEEIFNNTGIEVKTNYSNTESFLNDFLGE